MRCETPRNGYGTFARMAEEVREIDDASIMRVLSEHAKRPPDNPYLKRWCCALRREARYRGLLRT